jgi:hypothetical protein
MIGCNYNGWADLPEDEREGIDAFEATLPFSLPLKVVVVPMNPRLPVLNIPQRKAA